jgi:hypothetical protein
MEVSEKDLEKDHPEKLDKCLNIKIKEIHELQVFHGL